MEIKLGSQAKKDLEYWKKTGNQKVLKRIRTLTESIIKNPFSGIGSPEPLKHNLSGKWSRRITLADRYVYEIDDHSLKIHSLRGHYE